MPALKGTLKERLSRYHQIKISVIGRKSGQTILIPMRRVCQCGLPLQSARRKGVVTP